MWRSSTAYQSVLDEGVPLVLVHWLPLFAFVEGSHRFLNRRVVGCQGRERPQLVAEGVDGGRLGFTAFSAAVRSSLTAEYDSLWPFLPMDLRMRLCSLFSASGSQCSGIAAGTL